MKLRAWKTVALLATGGIVLQLGGCGGSGGIAALLIQNFAGLILSAILTAITGGEPTTA